MEDFYAGTVRRIIWMQGAIDTWRGAASQDSTKNQSCAAQMLALLKRLGDFQKLRSPTQINHEGEGIYAVKARCGLRAYGWFDSDSRKHAVFVVSHFIMKKKQRLNPKDLEIAKANKALFEKET